MHRCRGGACPRPRHLIHASGVGADLRVGPSEKGGHTGTPLHEPTVRFARADGAPAQRVVHGDDYARDFIGAGPWQATEQEWDLYLKNTGAFKKV